MILTCAIGETPSQTIASSAQPRLTAYATVAIHRFTRSSSRLKHDRPLTSKAPFFLKHAQKTLHFQIAAPLRRGSCSLKH
jgi:hypothetical protein